MLLSALLVKTAISAASVARVATTAGRVMVATQTIKDCAGKLKNS